MSEVTMDAADIVMSRVYAPKFIEKLAEQGITISTEQDLHNALKLAAHIAQQTQEPESNDKLAAAVADLDETEDSLAPMMGDSEVLGALASLVSG